MPVLLGAIADDFTAVSDLANTLVREGMRTVQTVGVPEDGIDIGSPEAVVVALKSRTIPAADAVGQSLAALRWLQGQGASQIIFKYCSTFDSTSKGNIGSVADALMTALGAKIAVVCPAFPVNGRTVYRGHLFVGDQLLSDSPMKDHPLTPMRDSNLIRLMTAQSSDDAGLVNIDIVRAGCESIAARFADLMAEGASYAITDAITERDLRDIGAAVAGHPLVTGGSGIALGLPANFRDAGALAEPMPPVRPTARGRAVVLAGSCSEATRGQVARACAMWPAMKLDPDRIAAGEDVVAEALGFTHRQSEDLPVLFHTSADPHEVAQVQNRHGRESAGAMIEATFGALATGLVEAGAGRIIVAGGETSGAVVSALGIRALRIGPEIDPGVPWTETLGERRLALALKSGNFGNPDFFYKALSMLE